MLNMVYRCTELVAMVVFLGIAPGTIRFVSSVKGNFYETLATGQFFSDFTTNGKRLIGNTIKTVNAATLAECFKECDQLLTGYCVSLNFAKTPTPGSLTHLCEINSKTADDDLAKFIDDVNYLYYDVYH